MPFSRLAERRIDAAIAQGEFDNLPNAGKPLDLDDYFSAPPDLRMAYSVLKNANCAPPEIELLKEVARLQQALDGAAHGDDRDRLQRLLRDRQTELAILLEPLSGREIARIGR